MNKLTLSYMAGFFDGEGSINISTRRRKHYSVEHSLSLAIGQKDGKTLDWIKDNFGGRIYTVNRDGSYYWTCSNKEAYKVIKQILPFLKYKKPQAELVLKFYEWNGGKRFKPVPIGEIERREIIRQELILMHKTVIKSRYAGSTTKRADSES